MNALLVCPFDSGTAFVNTSSNTKIICVAFSAYVPWPAVHNLVQDNLASTVCRLVEELLACGINSTSAMYLILHTQHMN